MNAREKPWDLKHRLLNLMHVLHRSVEYAVDSRPYPTIPELAIFVIETVRSRPEAVISPCDISRTALTV